VSTRIPSEELLDLMAHARHMGRNVTMLPGMSDAELSAVEVRAETLLPIAVRDLFALTAGFTVDDFVVAFGGRGRLDVKAFSHAIPVAADHDGTWVIDHDEGGWHPIIYVSRRPAAVVVQASTLTTFIAQIFEPGGPRRLLEPLLEEIARVDPYAVPRRSLLASRDGVLASFARELDDRYRVTDLRGQRAGVGFAYRRDTPLKRAGRAVVFAVPRLSRLRAVVFLLFRRLFWRRCTRRPV
jgi:hypothetical protein